MARATVVQTALVDGVEDQVVERVYQISLDPGRGRLGGDPLPRDLADFALDSLALCRSIRQERERGRPTPPPLPPPPPPTTGRRQSTRPRGVCVRCKTDTWTPNGRGGWQCGKCLP